MKEMVWPQIENAESEWRRCEELRYPQLGGLTLAELLHCDMAWLAVRAYCQLRVQGKLTMRGRAPGSPCPLCATISPPSKEHFIEGCGAVQVGLIWSSYSPQERHELLANPRDLDEAQIAIQACGDWRKALHEAAWQSQRKTSEQVPESTAAVGWVTL
jgi:hypothetical protein